MNHRAVIWAVVALLVFMLATLLVDPAAGAALL